MIHRLLALLLACNIYADARVRITQQTSTRNQHLHGLPVHIGGRALRRGENAYQRQWPGTYFETEFDGKEAHFKIGEGDAIYKVTIDREILSLPKPASGLYRINHLRRGKHHLRVEVVTESQSSPTEFYGFFAASKVKSVEMPTRPRQIEFIGDSHTVGYGNTSPKRECTEEEVWRTTDTSQGIAPLVVSHYDADYQVNAISGRGIVRNYNGFPGDTLPIAYPFTLLDHNARYDDARWHPQVIVLSLGTNDFSTPLHDGELWKTRDELHADYEKTYAAFLQTLRERNPDAHFVLWATDMSDGEIAAENRRVVDQVRAGGDQRITFVPVQDLAFSACNFHPSLADDHKIADALSGAINATFLDWK